MSSADGVAAGGLVASLIRPSTRQSIPLFPSGGDVCTLGCASGQDVILNDPGVREAHARLHWKLGRLVVEPLQAVSVNGVGVSGPTALTSGDWLSLGKVTLQVLIMGTSAVEHPAPQQAPKATDTTPRAAAKSVAINADGKPLTIGRLPVNDVCIPSPVVSRNHARIVREQSQYFIEDLASTNGTYINGQRVRGRTQLYGGERLQFGTLSYLFSEGRLHEIDGVGVVRIEARGVERIVNDAATGKAKPILTDVSFAIQPGEFVVIFGTTGSGKSTLMDALNGRRRPTGGSILYNGFNLADSFDSFKASIGYVPQQDIVHRRISIYNALGYTAKLRLPEDTSETEIAGQIDRVLGRVGMADKVWQPIDTPAPLSGGQLKRVSLAIELIANPSVLFLDEVTSGLDAGTDEDMMNLFADLASDGKTIICVTHTLENIDVCNLVIVLHAGRMVFFGPPAAVTQHFEIDRPKDVYKKLKTKPADQWAEAYKNSAFYADFVGKRLSAQSSAPAKDDSTAISAHQRATWFDLRHAAILTRRYVDLILADRKTLAVLLAMAPGIGMIFGSVFTTGGTIAARIESDNKLIILMTMTMVFCGCFNSCREIVKELPVYLRERTVNLGIGSYLISKVGPLAAICLWQAFTLLVVITLLAPVPGNEGARLIPLFLTGMAATMMGLTISALVSKPDMALPIALLISFPQIALANALVTLPSGAEAFAKVSVIAFWGYDCLKTTLAPEIQQAVGFDGQPVLPIAGSYRSDLLILLVFSAAFFAAAALGLKRRDP